MFIALSGLSNCTLIKELYLAGNKISEAEGLHRLLKLTVLDLSFNKITTAKALGQLVANYHSLLALNLIGNPVQANIGDDHLRKTVCSLLPNLSYLNKQPIKQQRAREAVTDSIAKAALGTGISVARRKGKCATQSLATGSFVRRTSQSSGLGSLVAHQKGGRHRSTGKHHHSSSSRKWKLIGNRKENLCTVYCLEKCYLRDAEDGNHVNEIISNFPICIQNANEFSFDGLFSLEIERHVGWVALVIWILLWKLEVWFSCESLTMTTSRFACLVITGSCDWKYKNYFSLVEWNLDVVINFNKWVINVQGSLECCN